MVATPLRLTVSTMANRPSSKSPAYNSGPK
jgi:hypothetical protein